MPIPGKVTGYGNNSAARNVFAITVSQPLASPPQFEAYDGAEFPAVGLTTSATGKALVGTVGNGALSPFDTPAKRKSMVCVVSTDASAPAANWKPAAQTLGAASSNRLRGLEAYTVSTATLAGGTNVGSYGAGFSKAPGALGNGTGAVDSDTNPAGVFRWNEVLEIPSDITPSDDLTYDLVFRYQYTTGTPPVIRWYFNDGGTDVAPVWTELTPNTHGLRHCNAGTVVDTYRLDIPPTGVVDAAEGWITP